MNTDLILDGQDPLIGVLARLAVEIVVLIIIIPIIYRRFSGNKEHMFSFFLIGIMIFSICVLLKNVELQMGLALGLFAIFSIIRYRTSNISIKDMSYLFTILGASAINAMFDFPNPVRGTILINSIIILTLLLLELAFKGSTIPNEIIGGKKKMKQNGEKGKKEKPSADLQLVYNNLEFIKPDRMDELMKDISTITGKSIKEVKIRKIDLINGYAELDVFFNENPGLI